MSEIELSGLRGDLPIGAMAAFGVLRVLSRNAEILMPRLRWIGSGGDYKAVLATKNDVNAETILAALLEDVRERRSKMPGWEQVKTCTAAEFVPTAKEAADSAAPQERELADWIAALANELAVSKEGKLQSTPFDMSVARQKFLADAVRLASNLGANGVDAYKEAVFGPWRYRDDQHSLGWDPTTIKLGAFTYKAPTGMANTGVRAAVWLAFESLPLFPCFYDSGLRTRSFVPVDRNIALRWPIWSEPIGVIELATLLGWAALDAPDMNRAELGARGMKALYRSVRFKPNQYMVTFRPSELLYMED